MKPVDILRQLEKLPNKMLGQNFLVDEEALTDIVAAAKLEAEDTVVEIGPGLGVLTRELAKKARQVIAVELDRDLAEYVRNLNLPNVTVVTGNALDIDWTVSFKGDYKVVANIPYSITSPLLRKMFSQERRPTLAVLLVQKEVAERVAAKAGNRDRGYLTMLTEANARAEIVRTVKPGSFHPAPKVDSAVLKLTMLPESRLKMLFWPAVEAAFRHPRQTAANGIANQLHLPKGAVERALTEAGVDTMARPAMLTFEQWQKLSVSIEELLKKA